MMEIRETLNEKPGLTTAVTAGIVVLALMYILYSVWPRSNAVQIEAGREYYTSDLGRTYTPEPAGTIWDAADVADVAEAPTRAWVFRYGEEPAFVAFLERVTPDRARQHRQLAEGEGKGADPMRMLLDEQDKSGRLVARPGEDQWVPMDTEAGRQISDFPKRDGNYVAQVLPQ